MAASPFLWSSRPPTRQAATSRTLQCGKTGEVATTAFTVTAVGSITLVKTVGTDLNACATTSTLTVPTGTTVLYCYTITNHTGFDLQPSSITDDHFPIFYFSRGTIPPGHSLVIFGDYFLFGSPCGVSCGRTEPAAKATITANTTNTATVNAYAAGLQYQATASATVLVPALAPVAVAAGTTPTFTG